MITHETAYQVFYISLHTSSLTLFFLLFLQIIIHQDHVILHSWHSIGYATRTVWRNTARSYSEGIITGYGKTPTNIPDTAIHVTCLVVLSGQGCQATSRQSSRYYPKDPVPTFSTFSLVSDFFKIVINLNVYYISCRRLESSACTVEYLGIQQCFVVVYHELTTLRRVYFSSAALAARAK